jgi:hypothetical protein
MKKKFPYRYRILIEANKFLKFIGAVETRLSLAK